MAALTAERNTPALTAELIDLPVKAATTIFAGSIVVADAGYAAPGRTATGLVALGRCEATVSAVVAGDAKASIRPGIYRFANLAADAVAQANICTDCYIVDDQTVAKTSGGGTRSRAGMAIAVDSSGVWVMVGP